jgi:phosphoglycerate dehydrogenase-like enzyme
MSETPGNDRVFQVGVTRDSLLPESGSLMADMGLEMLAHGEARWEFLPDDPGYQGEVTPELIAGYDGLFVLGSRFTARSFEGRVAERLVCLARWGVGYDRIDVPACTAAGVALTITPEGVRRSVALAALGLVLALALKLPLKDRLVREGRAGERGRHFSTGLTGRTLGSVGLGNIGTELFRLAAPLEMRLLATDPYADAARAAKLGIDLVPLERLLAESDFLCINSPLTPETRGMIDAAALARMKPTAYLINTARGEIVQTEALVAALAAGRLAGAGLDVTDPEPLPPDHPLCRMEQVILAPHALAWTDELALDNGRSACRSLLACARGEAPAPPQLVNREVLESPLFRAKLARWRV